MHNIENAIWLIDHLVDHYLEGRDEYNAYKHGLRVLTGQHTLSIGLHTGPGGASVQPVEQFSSPDSVTFLQFQGSRNDTRTVREVTKHVNPNISVFYISKMAQMADTMRQTRLSAI